LVLLEKKYYQILIVELKGKGEWDQTIFRGGGGKDVLVQLVLSEYKKEPGRVELEVKRRYASDSRGGGIS